MEDRQLVVNTVKRKNNSTFPTIVTPQQKSIFSQNKSTEKDDLYQVNMKTLETLLDETFKCQLSRLSLGDGKAQVDMCKTFIKQYNFSESLSELAKKILWGKFKTICYVS